MSHDAPNAVSSETSIHFLRGEKKRILGMEVDKCKDT